LSLFELVSFTHTYISVELEYSVEFLRTFLWKIVKLSNIEEKWSSTKLARMRLFHLLNLKIVNGTPICCHQVAFELFQIEEFTGNFISMIQGT